MPVYTFLDSFDFSGKKILPFCTNEGSGLSDTVREIAAECPGATVTRSLSITGHRAAQAAPQVERWLKAELQTVKEDISLWVEHPIPCLVTPRYAWPCRD